MNDPQLLYIILIGALALLIMWGGFDDEGDGM